MRRRGFIKLAVIRTLDAIGGIAGGERATGLSKSQVGRWHNRNDADLPGLEHILALDEASLACGGRAEILAAMASELGHVAFELPRATGEAEALAVQLAEATARFGNIAQVVVTALADNHICNREQGQIAASIDEAVRELMMLRTLVIEEESAVVRFGGRA